MHWEDPEDRVEREVGRGIGKGNTCISMADSCQCMTKTIKKKKKRKKQIQKDKKKKETGKVLVFCFGIAFCNMKQNPNNDACIVNAIWKNI